MSSKFDHHVSRRFSNILLALLIAIAIAWIGTFKAQATRVATCPSITDKYAQLGGASYFGKQLTTVRAVKGGLGLYQLFARGSIWWSKGTCAHALEYWITRKYQDQELRGPGWRTRLSNYRPDQYQRGTNPPNRRRSSLVQSIPKWRNLQHRLAISHRRFSSRLRSARRHLPTLAATSL